MGIEVQLRGEDGEVLAEVHDARAVLRRATSGALVGTRLLRYLLPWGDAMFNQAQANDLRHDIRQLTGALGVTPLAELLSQIEPLIDRLSTEDHVYLWFVGD